MQKVFCGAEVLFSDVRGGLVEPANVAHVLTIGKLRVLRIEAISHLVASGEVDACGELEGVEVSFTRNELHREYFADMFVAIGAGHDHEVDSDCIVKSLFVHHVTHGEFLTADEGCALEVFAACAADHLDAVPTFCHAFLPGCDVASDAVVVSGDGVETCGEGIVEAGVVVVELTLHRVVRSDASDGVS